METGSNILYINDILQELQGPAAMRFYIQPIVALILGIKDGVKDAREGKPPYLLHLFLDPDSRFTLWKSGLKSTIKPFLIAWLIDTLIQIFFLKKWNPFQALIIGFILIVLPYGIARALTNRVVSRKSFQGPRRV